jgi:hypothetical protein
MLFCPIGDIQQSNAPKMLDIIRDELKPAGYGNTGN